jgi:guanylate kinase
MNKKVKTIFISGPSGSGKTTVVKLLLERKPEIEKPVSCTTRAPRPGEVEGRDYYFLSPENFQKELTAGNFLEHAEVYGQSYGTRAQELEKIKNAGHLPLIQNDPQGSLYFKKILPADERVLIFIAPESLEQLKQQISDRQENMSAEALATRLKTAESEMALAKEFNFQVINRSGHLEETVAEVVKIINNFS